MDGIAVVGFVFIAACSGKYLAVVHAATHIGSRSLSFGSGDAAYDSAGGTAGTGRDAVEDYLSVIEAAADMYRATYRSGYAAGIGSFFAEGRNVTAVHAVGHHEGIVGHAYDTGDIGTDSSFSRNGTEVVAAEHIALGHAGYAARIKESGLCSRFIYSHITGNRASVHAVFDVGAAAASGNAADNRQEQITDNRNLSGVLAVHHHARTRNPSGTAAGDTSNAQAGLFLELAYRFRTDLSGIAALADDITVGADKAADKDGSGSISASVGDAALVGTVPHRTLVYVGDETEIVLSAFVGGLDGAGLVDSEVRHFPALFNEFEQACTGFPVFAAEAAAVETAGEGLYLRKFLYLAEVDVGRKHYEGVALAPRGEGLAFIAGRDEILKILGAAYALRKRIRAREEGGQYEN